VISVRLDDFSSFVKGSSDVFLTISILFLLSLFVLMLNDSQGNEM
jgi:hypothetical protein